MLLMPDRSRAWSSAMIRRAGLVSLSTVNVLPGAFERYARHDEGAAPRPAQDLKRAAEQGDPLLHARDADPLSGAARADHLGCAEPSSAISHPQTHLLPQATDAKAHARSIRVFAHVRQRLLDDPLERGLQRGRDPLAPEFLIVGDLPPFRPEILALQTQRRRQPEVVERRRPETGDDPPRLFYGLLDEGQVPRQGLPDPRVVRRMLLGEGLQVLLDGDDHLGEPVVYFVGYPAPLLFLGHDELAEKFSEPAFSLRELCGSDRHPLLQGLVEVP